MSESTEEQHINGLSLPAQKKALTEYALAQHYSIVGYYADEGISARKSMKNRKGLLQLLEEVKKDNIDMILVTKLDRWFRNIKDYHITEEILQTHRCHWKTIFEHYDSSTANGQMIINIMLSVNQAECDRTSERIKAVLDYKRSIGEVTSGKCACYGYKVVNSRLVKDESVSPIVEDAFKHYFSCYSIRSTIKYINEKYGDSSPSNSKIERFFKNETYAGRDKDNLHYCEPYISSDQFDQIQQITGCKIYPCKNDEPYLFSSLIKCPWCQNNYTGYRKRQKLKNGKESVYIRYRCANKFNRHSCAHLTERKIEEYLLTHLSCRFEQEFVQIHLKKPLSPKRDNSSFVQKEMDRLNLLFQKGRISESYYDTQYENLKKKMDEYRSTEKYTPSDSSRALFSAFNGSLQELYHALDKAHKQAFWKSTLKDIQIDKDTRRICGFNFLLKMEQ